MIDLERASRALRFLAQTDEELATLKVEHERALYRCELVRAQQRLLGEGSVADRKDQAEKSREVIKAEARRLKALGKYEHLKARRATAIWTMDLWRSLNANRRQGNP